MPPEELRDESLGWIERHEPGTAEALGEAQRMEGRDVIDHAGRRMGSIARAFVEDGELVEVEVRLDKALAQSLGVPDDVARVRAEELTEEGESFRARSPAEALLPVPPRPTEDKQGARGRPRKVR